MIKGKLLLTAALTLLLVSCGDDESQGANGTTKEST